MKYVWLIALAACASGPDTRPETLDYITEAILVPYCGRGGCHSTNTAAGRIILDNVADARKAMKTGRADVVPGNPDASRLVSAIKSTSKPMPPDEPLPDADLELIRRWIADGAEGL